MTSDLDTYRSAHVLIRKHGEDAVLEPVTRAHAMLDRGDLDGSQMWKRILRAVEELQRESPRDGERRH